ncbi:MAG: DNA methylase [Bacteroidota bacterium]|nr:DNA methylase [Bacteroidota bacterium]
MEAAAAQVLAARADFPTESLATRYDPLMMPPALVRAHSALDRAVDLCYRPAAFATELARLEFLVAAYRALQTPLLPPPAKAGRRAKT